MSRKDITSTAVYRECLELFIASRGRNLVAIERELRRRGHCFNRRSLYTRNENGVVKPGWIERFAWRDLSQMRSPSAAADDAGAPAAGVPQGTADFRSWLRRVSPTMHWDWKHQQVIIDALDRVTRGESKRLMIFVPPRHGKSELVSVRYSAFRMTTNPKLNVILASYNQQLANRFSRKVRNVIVDSEQIRLADAGFDTAAGSVTPETASARMPRPEGARTRNKMTADALPAEPEAAPAAVSPFPFSRPRRKNAVSEWETTVGGGFRAVGVGAGITGFGADLVIIDDPIKSRAEAESFRFRERIWNWFNDDLYTRLEPDAAMILIQTRWHEDDLAGRLLQNMLEQKEKWDVISLPAIAEEMPSTTPAPPDDDPARTYAASGNLPPALIFTRTQDWRQKGEALCPERFDGEALEKLRRQLGTYSFSALYQQRPTPAEGGIFKRNWFARIVAEAPPGLRWARGYDLAVSQSTAASYTASLRCAFDSNGDLYIADGFRCRIEYPDQRRFVIERIRSEPDTLHAVEKALHGSALLQDLRRERSIRGNLLRGIAVAADKVTRALTWSPLAEEGKVVLVRGGWIGDFLDEASAFPGSDHNDQIDAVSVAVAALARKTRRSAGF